MTPLTHEQSDRLTALYRRLPFCPMVASNRFPRRDDLVDLLLDQIELLVEDCNHKDAMFLDYIKTSTRPIEVTVDSLDCLPEHLRPKEKP